jgi:hypothetical protein
MIARTAAAFNLPPESLAAAITNLQKPLMNKLPTPRKGKPRSELKSKMPREVEKPDERDQLSHSNQHKALKNPIYNSAKSEMPNPMQGDVHEERSRPDPGSSVLDECFGFKIVPTIWTDCFANRPFYDQDLSYEQRQGMFQAPPSPFFKVCSAYRDHRNNES